MITWTLYASLVALRLWGLAARWNLPRIENPALLRRYRLWLVLPSLAVEAIALTDVLLFNDFLHVAWIHGTLTILLGIQRGITLRNFVLASREEQTVQPEAARIAVSLQTRRLADYTNRDFEIANTIIALCAFIVILRSQWPPFILTAIVVIYAQLGGLLWKRALVRRAVPIPAQNADEYLRVVEEGKRLVMRTLDQLRGTATFALCLLAVRSIWWEEWERRGAIIDGAVLLAFALFAIVMIARYMRRARAFLARARQLQAPATRPLLDPENLRLGGLFYVNADNPAVVVNGGPFRYAINVVNKLTYLYAAYFAGWAVLLVLKARP